MITSGLRTSRCIWRRRRWKYWAAVVALATWMLSSAQRVRNRSTRADAVLGALALVVRAGSSRVRPERLAPLVLGGGEVLVDDDHGRR
jgi:hypothetical protein